jgi:hypothetical protein
LHSASDWIIVARHRPSRPGHSRSNDIRGYYSAPIPAVCGVRPRDRRCIALCAILPMASTASQPTTRSRTNLFVSYRDSQARASRYARSRRTYDADDTDAGEAQRLIVDDRPETAALHIDVAPPWCVCSCVPVRSNLPPGWTSQTRSKQPSSIRETRVRGTHTFRIRSDTHTNSKLRHLTLPFPTPPLIPD